MRTYLAYRILVKAPAGQLSTETQRPSSGRICHLGQIGNRVSHARLQAGDTTCSTGYQPYLRLGLSFPLRPLARDGIHAFVVRDPDDLEFNIGCGIRNGRSDKEDSGYACAPGRAGIDGQAV